MVIVRIRFLTREDEAVGVVPMARYTRIDALPDGVYAVRETDLNLLEDAGLRYEKLDGERTGRIPAIQ